MPVFVYILAGFPTPSCGLQSWTFGSLGTLQVVIDSEDEYEKTLTFDSSLVNAGSTYVVEIETSLDYVPDIKKTFMLNVHVYEATLTPIAD